MQTEYEELLRTLGKVNDLTRAGAILQWDQQTYMPPGGLAARVAQCTTLESLAHESFTAPRVGELLAALAPWAEEQGRCSVPASLLRVTRREYERYRKLSPALVAAMAEAAGLGFDAWQRAKRASDFSLFLAPLERLVGLAREEAEALGYDDEPYDALLDLYEPGVKTRDVAGIFARLEHELVPLAWAVSACAAAGPDPLAGLTFAAEEQQAFARELLAAMGYDFDRGRVDVAEHPFTTAFAPGDVRVTNHPKPQDVLSNIFSTIHEGGHALYEQGVPLDFARTPLGTAASLGAHESQSRLWENIIGRSLAFWEHFYPRLQARFPGLARVPLDAFYRAANRVRPSLIRVEADEATYNLHVLLRFELERELLNGTAAVADLPGLWRERMRRYLGVEPANDAEGVLQDVHWSSGSIGYFPTYTLGNLLSAQIYARVRAALPDLEDAIRRGELLGLKRWLNENLYVHGAKYELDELTRLVTGGPLSVEPYLEYLREKYGEIYGLRLS